VRARRVSPKQILNARSDLYKTWYELSHHHEPSHINPFGNTGTAASEIVNFYFITHITIAALVV
jgi:hypothetical protein